MSNVSSSYAQCGYCGKKFTTQHHCKKSGVYWKIKLPGLLKRADEQQMLSPFLKVVK